MSAVEDAQRAVTEFLLAIPAVRDSGIIAPLQGLLAALPGLIRLASRFNQLTDDLTEANADPDAITLAKGGTQLSMFVRFHEDATGGEIGATLRRHASSSRRCMIGRMAQGEPCCGMPY